MDIEFRAGDLFATRNPQALGRGINAVQTWWSKDGEAVYSHTGIIIDTYGSTFEALWTLKRQNLDAYIGESVCIARWGGMTDEIARDALEVLMGQQEGRIYPAWRLFFHIVPPIAKYASWGGKFIVCSELVAKFLYIVYQQNGWTDEYGYKWPRHSHYCGANPDMLSDEWHRWRGWNIIFEGMLEAP